jgi:hypothetical protein
VVGGGGRGGGGGRTKNRASGLAVEPEQDANTNIIAITACGGSTSLHNHIL